MTVGLFTCGTGRVTIPAAGQGDGPYQTAISLTYGIDDQGFAAGKWFVVQTSQGTVELLAAHNFGSPSLAGLTDGAILLQSDALGKKSGHLFTLILLSMSQPFGLQHKTQAACGPFGHHLPQIILLRVLQKVSYPTFR